MRFVRMKDVREENHFRRIVGVNLHWEERIVRCNAYLHSHLFTKLPFATQIALSVLGKHNTQFPEKSEAILVEVARRLDRDQLLLVAKLTCIRMKREVRARVGRKVRNSFLTILIITI